jgi:hypothetical protein
MREALQKLLELELAFSICSNAELPPSLFGYLGVYRTGYRTSVFL